MNFKPFYIRDLNVEDRQIVYEKATAAGARDYELPYHWDDLDCYGVDAYGDTVAYEYISIQELLNGGDCWEGAVEITLDQLDEHLGLNTNKLGDKL